MLEAVKRQWEASMLLMTTAVKALVEPVHPKAMECTAIDLQCMLYRLRLWTCQRMPLERWRAI